jgi:hypothetical protein
MENDLFEEFAMWLRRVNELDPPPEDIVAFNFGLFESTDGYVIYVTGAKSFDPEDADWASSNDWSPNEKYFYGLAKETLGKDLERVQNLAIELVKEFLDTPIGSNSFLAASEVTVGFDDGDLVRATRWQLQMRPTEVNSILLLSLPGIGFWLHIPIWIWLWPAVWGPGENWWPVLIQFGLFFLSIGISAVSSVVAYKKTRQSPENLGWWIPPAVNASPVLLLVLGRLFMLM